MYKVDEELLIKEPHFPTIRPVVEEKISSFLDKAKSFFTYRRKFEIMEEICIWSNMLERYIYIPASLIVDGASVPKVLNGVYSSTGVLFYGSFPHDFGYRYAGLFLVDDKLNLKFVKFSKGELDDIFLDVCKQENNMPNVSKIAKWTLTAFGFTG
jgi:hypothetical protein